MNSLHPSTPSVTLSIDIRGLRPAGTLGWVVVGWVVVGPSNTAKVYPSNSKLIVAKTRTPTRLHLKLATDTDIEYRISNIEPRIDFDTTSINVNQIYTYIIYIYICNSDNSISRSLRWASAQTLWEYQGKAKNRSIRYIDSSVFRYIESSIYCDMSRVRYFHISKVRYFDISKVRYIAI